MAPPRSRQQESGAGENWRALRRELDSLADALVDANPSDRPALHARVAEAVSAHRRFVDGQDDLRKLLRHMLFDLAGDSAPVDTLYYARQLVVVADRLPN